MAIAGETSLQQLLDESRMIKLQAERAQELHPKLSFRPSMGSHDPEDHAPYTGDGAEALASALKQLLTNLSPAKYKRCKIAVLANYTFKPDVTSLLGSTARLQPHAFTNAQLVLGDNSATLYLTLAHRPLIQVYVSPHNPHLYLRVEYPEFADYFANTDTDVGPVYLCLKRGGGRQKYFFASHVSESEFPPTRDSEEPRAVAPTARTELTEAARATLAEKIDRRQKERKDLQLARAKKAKQRDRSRRSD